MPCHAIRGMSLESGAINSAKLALLSLRSSSLAASTLRAAASNGLIAAQFRTLIHCHSQDSTVVDVFHCNNIIRRYVNDGSFTKAWHFFAAMLGRAIPPDKFTLPLILKSCPAPTPVQILHCHSIKRGLFSDIFVSNSLINAYAQNGFLDFACHVFDQMADPDTVSWNSILGGFAENGRALEALEFFNVLRRSGVETDSFTAVNALSACAHLNQTEEIHAYLVKTGLKCSSIFVRNSLITAYGKWNCLDDARQVFEEMTGCRNTMSWNAIICSYAQSGDGAEALALFESMKCSDAMPNATTMVGVLQASANELNLQQGLRIHNLAVKSGVGRNRFVQNALLEMYSKCGLAESARRVFDEIEEKDVVPWTAMIGLHAGSGMAAEAMDLFSGMMHAGVRPNELTIVNALSACTDSVTAFQQGQCLHCWAVRAGFEANSVVGTVLVDFYAKCGILESARRVFDGILDKTSVSWTVMISGYAKHGRAQEAMAVFELMLQTRRIVGNHVVFLSVMSACTHAGLVEEGCRYLERMEQEHGMVPTQELCSCMVGLLCRARRFDDAVEYIERRVPPQVQKEVLWEALLAACMTFGRQIPQELCRRTASHSCLATAGSK